MPDQEIDPRHAQIYALMDEGLTPYQIADRYRPLVSRREATGSLLADFVQRFFRGSPERLVLSLVDARHLSPADLREIEAKLAQPPADEAARPKRPRRKS